MNKKIISFLLVLSGTALVYTAVRFLLFEPNAFKGNGDLIYTIFRTSLGILGFSADVYGILPLFKSEPPALAITPDTAKLSLDLPLIGRNDDLGWLQNGNGDRLLIGQPGSGKTFLLYKFAKESEGLFVNDFNLGRVTGEYKRKKPKTIIVDDAQLHIDFINTLINYRKRKSAKFDILASCWPSHEADVLNVLNIPTSSSHYLNLLTLDQLVDVVKAVGLMGPDGLIQEIVEQSVGRPGLAVALTDLCLKEGGVQDIVLGDALARWVTTKLLPAPNSKNVSAILAAFSIGGDMGMPMIAVASRLGLNLLEVQSVISNLVGGLIFDNTPNLVIYPPVLRHSLVRDIFFRGAVSLSIAEFIKSAPSLHEAAKTLLGARRRGANIPQEFLLDILKQLNSSELWEEFAYLGQGEATWILENKPQFLIAIARPALLNAPDKVIPLLLTAAIGDDRELHSSTDHPVRIIQDWVLSAYPGKGQAVRHRKILLTSVTAWINETENQAPGVHALQIIMSPEFSSFTSSPGSGNKWIMSSGHLTISELSSLKELWYEILPIIKKISIQDWAPIRQLVENWAYPGRLGHNVTEEVYEEMKAFASQMILDILPIISAHPGFLHWAHNISRMANISIEVPIDSIFETLYPDVNPVDFHKNPSPQHEAVIHLAQLWSTRSPADVVKDILEIEKEAQLIGNTWPRLTPLLCFELSKATNKQRIWVEEGRKNGWAGDLIRPFLNKVVEGRRKGWIGILKECLYEPMLKAHVVEIVLTGTKMPIHLLDVVYLVLENTTRLIEILCMSGEIPENRVLRLLKHNNPEVALAAAKGEWMLNPTKIVRKSLERQWELVIINFLQEDYLLGEIFAKRPGLASSWLSARMHEATNNKERIAGYRLERAFGMAANSLGFKDRQSLLKTMLPFSYDYLMVTHLVGDSIELYQELLANKNIKYLHLNPLYGKPTDAWALRVIAALNSGYGAKEIAHATRWGEMKITSWSGNESDMWNKWIKHFEPYLLHAEERIREVAKICIENAKYSRDKASQDELKEAVFGRR